MASSIGLVGCGTTMGPGTTITQGVEVSRPAVGGQLIAALEGGLVGQVADVELSGQDRNTALSAEYRALEYTAPAQPVFWQSRNQTISGTVVPSQPYRVGTQDCRQYALTLNQGAQTVTQRGTACRNDDGTWTLVS